MEKTYPAGTKRLGYMSESSAVVFPFSGRAFARPFMTTVDKKATMLTIWSILRSLVLVMLNFFKEGKINIHNFPMNRSSPPPVSEERT